MSLASILHYSKSEDQHVFQSNKLEIEVRGKIAFQNIRRCLFMLNNIGVPGLVLILVIALVIFGPSKLPEVGRAFGRTIKEFKSATKDIIDDNDKEKKES